MTNGQSSYRISYVLLLLILLASLPIKLAAAQNMPFDIDIVVVLSRLVEYDVPPVGTLSSVAAYNMPMLSWLHLPALTMTLNAYSAILLTMLTFNIITTIAVFCIGDSMFNPRVGLVAALMFTVSEVGISSAYTAWAQLLLPGFYALTFLFLWQWRKHEKGIYLALSGIIATAAFMTNFSAILLYPTLLVFALISRAKWQWRWFLGGGAVCLLMLAPYVIYEKEHDFVDIRAFLRQESRISADVLAQVQYLKPESGLLPREQPNAVQAISSSQSTSNTPPPSNAPTIKARWQRALDFALSIPAQAIRGLNLGFNTTLRGLPSVFRLALYIPPVLFVMSVAWAIWGFVWQISGKADTIYHVPTNHHDNVGTSSMPSDTHNEKWYSRLSQYLIDTPQGRIILILLFVMTLISGLIVTRSIDQPTYFMGLTSLEIVIAAAIFSNDRLPRWLPTFGAVLVLTYGGVSMAERVARLNQHDDAQYSRFNVSIYRHVSDTVDYIAADWQGADTVTVSYDIMPEMRNLWWVAAWNSIDSTYRMGMNFDFLLLYHHGLQNTNTDPVGYVETANYFVVYELGLARFNLDDYTIAQFGTIYVLKLDE
ncbi:MAG: glycosyltransferase family 39 protein [Anaerolineae bacterium]|nr:glycosyltransferase family 39 protein [Anaerolineae bacterium]